MNTVIVGGQTGLGELCAKLFVNAKIFTGDILCENDIISFVRHIDNIHYVVYTAGVNHINEFDKQSSDDFYESMGVNVFGFVRLLQEIRAQDKFEKRWPPVACLVTSNAANVAMRHSLSYNCSKAAANMAIKQMAREIHPDELTIFGVAPNKLKGTPMSRMIEKKVCDMRGWSTEEAAQYQIEALPARKETDPWVVARLIFTLMRDGYTPYIHGNIIPIGGPV